MRYIYKLHQITGVISAVFLFILCITGSILLFHGELNAWNTGVPISSEAYTYDSIWQQLDGAEQKLHKKNPNAVIRNVVVKPTVSKLVFSVDNKGQKEKVNISVEKNKSSTNERWPWLNSLIKGAEDLHVTLAFSSVGQWIMVGAAFSIVVAVISGGIFYWPRRKQSIGQAFKRPGRCIATFHSVAGLIVGLWVVAMAISGAFLGMASYIYPPFVAQAKTDSHAPLMLMEQVRKDKLSKQVGAIDKQLTTQSVRDYVQQQYPNSYVVGMDYPDVKQVVPHYVIYITEATSMPFVKVGQPVFVPVHYVGEPMNYTVKRPWSVIWLGVCRAVHLQSHESLAAKGLWLVLLILGAALSASGVVLFGKKLVGKRKG